MQTQSDVKVFGFWVYLMTDLILFCVLFATYIVLCNNTFSGPSARQLFSMQEALTETLLLLVSSFTCSLGMLAVYRKRKVPALLWFLITFCLGVAFLVVELTEFSHFLAAGAGWTRSAFLSAFFTLVGTHGLHISVGLIWMLVALVHIGLRPFTAPSISRIFRMALFWHFLDLVWVFIFTVVYGMGHLQ